MKRILIQILLFLSTLLLFNAMCHNPDPNWCKKDHHCEMPANWIVYGCTDCDSVTNDSLSGFYGSYFENQYGDIQIDSKGNIWFYNFHELKKFDGKNFSKKLSIPFDFSQNTQTGLFFGYYSFYFDSHDNLWIASPKVCVSRYNGNNWTKFSTDGVIPGISDEGVPEMICSIYEDTSGLMWFGTRNGYILSFDGSIWKSYIQPLKYYYPLIIRILGDSKGNIYFLRYNDILKYDGTNFSKIIPKQDPNSKWGLTMSTFLIDKTDNIWVGTSGSGYAKFVNSEWIWLSNTKIDNDNIYDVNQDKEGKIWITTNDSVVSFDVNNMNHQAYTLGAGGLSKGANKIIIDKNNNKWFLGKNYVVYRYTGQ